MTSEPARILVIDDHPLIRLMLSELIDATGDLEVCSSAGTIAEGIEQITQLRPDLAIIDLSLDDGNGLTLARQILDSVADLKVIIFTAHDNAVFARQARDLGAHGFIGKKAEPVAILTAIRDVLSGRFSFANDSADTATDELSARELEILELIGKGLGNSTIAQRLNRSVKTIESHRNNLKRKLNLASSSELNLYAMQWLLEHG